VDGQLSINGSTTIGGKFNSDGTASIGGTGTLTIGPTGSVLSQGIVSFGSGQVDLSGSLTFAFADDALSLDFTLKDGRAGGLWNGPGIASSAAASDPSRIAVGYLISGSSLPGQVGMTLIRPTLIGDTNLDGAVNFTDLLALAQHYGGTDVSWQLGDFDYDKSVGFDDLLALAQNYGSSLGAAVQLSQPTDPASQAPEPDVLWTTGLAVIPLLRRRRRAMAVPIRQPLAAELVTRTA